MKLEVIIEDINNAKNIFELIDKIKEFLKYDYANQELDKIKTYFHLEYKKFCNNYKKRYKNILIYPYDKPSLIIGFHIDKIPNYTLNDLLFLIVDKYESEFFKQQNNHITIEEQLDIIDIAQKKYEFLDIAKLSKKKYNIFNFNYISKISSCHYYQIENKKNNNYIFEMYDVADNKDILNKYYIFAYGLGMFLGKILVKDPDEAPYGFARILKRENIKLTINNKRDLIKVFADVFAILLLKDTKYENSNMEIPLNIEKYIYKQIEIYKDNNTVKKIKDDKEIDDTEICPCGSYKTYEKCCKKKDFKWVKSGDNIEKQIPLNKEVYDSIMDFYKMREESLNRFVYNSEKIISGMTVFDMQLTKHIKELRNMGVSEKFLYAMYKTNRILNLKNSGFVSELEEKEFKEAMEEYNQYTKDDNEDNISIITGVLIANNILIDFFDTYYETCNMLINNFIREIGDEYGDFSNFNVKGIEDFLIFCARKLSINFNSFVSAIKNNDNDNAMSILRNLYEILININVYTRDKNLFKEKIMPLANIDLGICKFIENKDGSRSKNKVINLETNEIFDTKITMMDLSKKSNDLYFHLYKTLFNESSFYIHLNVSSVDSFFREKDPFLEVDSTNITSLLGIFLINQAIYELSKLDTLSYLLYRDMTYISDKIKEEMIPILELLIDIENGNDIYSTIIKIISDYDEIK